MGLDVYLYQFKGLDTDAILELSRFSREAWAWKGSMKWEDFRAKLAAKAQELGLPERFADDDRFGGVKVCFPSQKHPNCDISVGDWDMLFSYTDGILWRYTGRDFYYVFPEAEGDPQFIRPEWSAAKERMMELLGEFRKLGPKCLVEFEDAAENEFDGHVERMEVIIETLDYVLSHEQPREFLLNWCA